MMLGRQGELLAQLRELLLPSSPTSSQLVKVESGGALLSTGPPASCDGIRRRRGSKRGRDDKTNGSGEQHKDPAAQPRHYSSCKRMKKQQKSNKSLVTSVPDFDGYQWRKYGQKHIEGAMYARSYYRCTRSAEQGCPAKRTVQRNDDDGDHGGGAAPQYTVVYMGDHTCTATDFLEAPVILETTAVVPDNTSTNRRRRAAQGDDDDYTAINSNSIVPTTTSAGSCSTTTTVVATSGIESPAISDDMTWSSSGSSSDYYVVDEDYCGLLVDVHDDSWTPAPAAAGSSSLQDLITGPIRSPVHIPEAAGCWTFYQQFLLQLADDEPGGVCHFF